MNNILERMVPTMVGLATTAIAHLFRHPNRANPTLAGIEPRHQPEEAQRPGEMTARDAQEHAQRVQQQADGGWEHVRSSQAEAVTQAVEVVERMRAQMEEAPQTERFVQELPEAAAKLAGKVQENGGRFQHANELRCQTEALATAAALSRVKLEKNIRRQELALSDLYTQLNSLDSFTCRLPPEILATIFIHCACGYWDANDVFFDNFDTPRWVSVSYVCRHWRQVALNCPTLWTYISTVSHRWTEVLLARSKQAPLKVQVILGTSKDDNWWFNFVEKLMDHRERIEEFRLFVGHTRRSDALFFSKFVSKISSRAPRLQNLDISLGSFFAFPCSPLLFQGDTPALCTLKLSGCAVPWDSFRLSRLTTLNLLCIPNRFRQDMEEFLDTLTRMPDITNLYLDQALSSVRGPLPSKAFDASSNLSLPHLSRLLIVSPLSTVVAFLSRVNIPLKTEVRLACAFERDSSIDDYARLSPLLAQRFSISENQVLSGPKIRSIISKLGTEGPRLVFSAAERNRKTSVHISDTDWDCHIPLKILINMDQSTMSELGARITSDICCSLPLANVKSLHIIEPPLSLGFWRQMLEHLEGLRCMRLSNGSMPNLASMLTLTDAHEDRKNQGVYATIDRGPNRVFAPALKELRLHRITFSTRNPHLTPALVLSSLFDALSTRKGVRGRLIMTQCTIEGSHELADVTQSW